MEKIIVTGIYTENYKQMVELQKRSCKDHYIFDFRYITNEEWEAAKTSNQFAFFGGNTIKTQLVIDKIKKYWGKIILVADADVIFLKKTEKTILQELGIHDMVFLKERKDAINNPYEKTVMNINIGFVALRCNEKTLEFWTLVQQRVHETKGWDQEIANIILKEGAIQIDYTLFSDYFLNGGEITPDNVRTQLICTSCGTIAQKYKLTKYDYLIQVLEIATGERNTWFDGSIIVTSSPKKYGIIQYLKKFRCKLHGDLLQQFETLKKNIDTALSVSNKNIASQTSIIVQEVSRMEELFLHQYEELYKQIEKIDKDVEGVNSALKDCNNMITLTQKQIQQKPTIQYNTQQVAFQSTAQYVIKNMPKVPTFQKYLDILTFALQNVSVEGLYLEFGVYTGRTINHISSLVPNHTVYGFDSFEGLPCTWRTGFEKGAFKTNKLPDVNSNVVLIKGLFEETLQDFCQKHSENCSFIHIDSDLYRSAKCIFDVLKDKICSGTIIVFDEYFNYPGWEEGEHRAFMEFVSESKFEFEYIGYVDIHEQVAVRIL